MVFINYLNLNQHKQVLNEAKKVNTGLNIRWHMGLFGLNIFYFSWNIKIASKAKYRFSNIDRRKTCCTCFTYINMIKKQNQTLTYVR